MSGAQALLRAIIDDPTSRPGVVAECKGILSVLQHLGMDDVSATLQLVVGMLAGVQERLDQLERKREELTP